MQMSSTYLFFIGNLYKHYGAFKILILTVYNIRSVWYCSFVVSISLKTFLCYCSVAKTLLMVLCVCLYMQAHQQAQSDGETLDSYTHLIWRNCGLTQSMLFLLLHRFSMKHSRFYKFSNSISFTLKIGFSKILAKKWNLIFILLFMIS